MKSTNTGFEDLINIDNFSQFLVELGVESESSLLFELLDQPHQSKEEEDSKRDPLKHQDSNDCTLLLVGGRSVFQVISVNSVSNGKSQRDGGLTEEKSEFSLEFEYFQMSKSNNFFFKKIEYFYKKFWVFCVFKTEM